MNPLDNLSLALNRIQAQVQTMDVLIKQAQSAADNALAYFEQQIQELDIDEGEL